jgi:hypothetical protein
MKKKSKPGTFSREKLLETLKIVAPALDSAPVMPILSHILFDGKTATAYNNIVALRTPCDLPIVGAVPGPALLGMLSASAVKEITVEADSREALFLMGRAKFRAALLPFEESLFKTPRKGVLVELTPAFREVLRLASLGAETKEVKYMGILLEFSRRAVTVLATTGAVAFRSTPAMKQPELDGRSVILPSEFYNLLLKRNYNKLFVGEKGDLVATDGDTEIYGRPLASPRLAKARGVFEDGIAAKIPMALVPPLLTRCLERAALVSPDENVELLYDGKGLLTIHVVGEKAHTGKELRDSVKIDLGDKPIAVATAAQYVQTYLGAAQKIGIGQDRIVFTGENFTAMAVVRVLKDKE